ncbi:MAG: UDP-glucose dehydrogenase family protein [Oligoflexus sp.]
MRIVMIGSGYVGLVSGTCLAEVGHSVTCVDLDDKKIRLLKDGHSPIFEPGLEDMIRRNMEHERLNFSTDLASSLKDAEMAFIAVGTPEGEDGSADVSYVKAVAVSIGQLLDHDLTVVVKSTVPVGTCDMVQETIENELLQRQAKLNVTVASNPEFLKEGDAIGDFMKPDRIVVGLPSDLVEAQFLELYRPFILDDIGRLLFMDRRSSELTKYAANSMLATRISFMNELAILCESLGANIDQVRQGMGSDVRIGKKFLFPGPGYGGSCFPKDVAALRKTGQKTGIKLTVLDAVSEANERQKVWVTDKILDHFNDVKGKRIAVWGLAFKPGTDDVREAPAKTIISRLLDAGAIVTAHDPKAQANFAREFGERERLTYVDNAYGTIKAADALVLITEWSEYRRPNWDKVSALMANRLVIDLRNQYEARDLTKKGFTYSSVGRPHHTMG